MTIALIGNQNSGKTTLFNQLTGSNQRVGNFPGVTVEQKIGVLRGFKDVEVVDLPGIYSLSPYSSEEIVTRDYLLKKKPDGIINIADATNIERNLYLTLQLTELHIPMVLALNMMDEVTANHGVIRVEKLSEELGIPVVPISAAKNQGISELIKKAVVNSKPPQRVDFCAGAVHRAIHSIAHMLEDHADRIGVPTRFAATKLVEGDAPMLRSLGLSTNEVEMIEHTVLEMETELGTDREAALADMRYEFIAGLCADCVIKERESKEHSRSINIDKVLTSKAFGIPVFLGIMFLVFTLTFGLIGKYLSELLIWAVGRLTDAVDGALVSYGLSEIARSLIIDGAFAGVGAVISFLPYIITLFFFMSILEDSGYMARVAFVMDKLLRKLGLSGRSFVPMLMGFGCSVPAIMAARTLSSDRDRKMTILLIPFMSCGAKLPIYAMFTAAFFARGQALVMIAIYLMGIVLGILSALFMRGFAFRGAPAPFVMELPNYRFPSFKSVGLLLWDKTRDFLRRAFTVIMLATVTIWFLQSFDIRLHRVVSEADSILAMVGKVIIPIFRPLGFGDWRAATALISGFTAKEAVVGTMAVLTQSNISDLSGQLSTMFTPLSAFSFMTFTLLYTPCVAAVSTVKKEYGSAAGTLLVIFYQTGVAWAAAAVVYQVGRLFL